MAVDLTMLTQLRGELETFVGQLRGIVELLQSIPADPPATAEGLAIFAVTLTVGEGLSEDDWTAARMTQASIAIRDIINAISDDWIIGVIQFMETFGGVEIQLVEGPYEKDPAAAASTSMVDRPSGRVPVIYLYTRPTGASSDFVHGPENIVHEFGHVLVFRHDEIYREWNLIMNLISEYDTDIGWSDSNFDLLQNQSRLADVISGEISRLELEHERIANMFEAWVYDREPEINANNLRQLRAAWAMWIFMYGGCPEVAIDTTLTLAEQPCGTGFLNWIRQYGGNYEE